MNTQRLWLRLRKKPRSGLGLLWRFQKKDRNSSDKAPNRSVHGQTMIELALALPLLMVLFVGMMEVTFIGRTYLALLDASTAGTRLGAQGEVLFDNNEILTLVTQNLSREGYNTTKLIDVIIIRANLSGTTVSNYRFNKMLASDRQPRLTAAVLSSRLRSGDPAANIIAVEIVYDHQLLFDFLRNVFPSPLPVVAYSIQILQR